MFYRAIRDTEEKLIKIYSSNDKEMLSFETIKVSGPLFFLAGNIYNTPLECKIENALIKSVSETMQESAFCNATVVTNYWARLPLIAPYKGAFILMLPRALALDLAENMLHLPVEDIVDDVLLDVVSEMANTISGSFLRELFNDIIFELGLPERGVGWPDLEQEIVASYIFEVDHHTLSVVLAGNDFTHLT